jgi:glutamate N-acetyltransferase/amino-acid N-acetyltransferase
MSNKSICPGYTCAGLSAGIKKNDLMDLGLIYSEVPAHAAGLFTRNKVKAAPVVVTQKRIAARHKIQAILVNSGNANCCTGPQGLVDATQMGEAAAKELNIDPEAVLVASTGVIGEPLPIHKIHHALPHLADRLSQDGWDDLAQAILTTDTAPKLVSRTVSSETGPYTITGIAKGSGMIRPDMATMLCFVCTDAAVSQPNLQQALLKSTQRSFNRITVDGDTSTNDMVLLLANGRSGATIESQEDLSHFQHVLDDILLQLARAIVKDGEGATKLVEIHISGADSDASATAIADTIANSNLVKTALFGEDANWGRIVAAAGRAGVPFETEQVDLAFDDIWMVKRGQGLGSVAESAAAQVLKKEEFSIHLDLHLGTGCAVAITCDLSYDYVKINADYRS